MTIDDLEISLRSCLDMRPGAGVQPLAVRGEGVVIGHQ